MDKKNKNTKKVDQECLNCKYYSENVFDQKTVCYGRYGYNGCELFTADTEDLPQKASAEL